MQSERFKAGIPPFAARSARPWRAPRRRFGQPAGPSRALLALLLVFLSIGLAACTLPTTRLGPFTASLGPSDLMTRYRYDEYFYNPAATCPTYLAARDRDNPPGTLLVGADNYFDGGSGPLPCVVKDDYAYRGGVRFDLAEFRSYQGVIIENAILSWKIDRAIVRNGDGSPGGVPNGPDVTNCVGALMEGKQSPFTRSAFLPAIPYRRGPGDVTSLVQSWVMNGDPNWGFVLVGLNESYNRNNAACLNVISHFTLTITYSRT